MLFIDDIKTGFRLAKSNILSFLLALIGMLVMIAIITSLIVFPFVLIAVLSDPTDYGAFSEAVSQIISRFVGIFSPNLLGGLFGGGAMGLLLLLPMAAIAAWIFGGIFGMSKEIIENGGTHAESAFGYLRKSWKPYFTAGLIWALITFVPIWLIGLGVTAVTGFSSVPPEWEWPMLFITFLYFYLLLGFFMLYLPAVTDGVGIVKSLKESFKQTIENPIRVFGNWTVFVAIFAMFILPLPIYTTLTEPGELNLGVALLTLWTVFGVFFILLLVLPAMFLTFTKIYLSLDKKPSPSQEVGF